MLRKSFFLLIKNQCEYLVERDKYYQQNMKQNRVIYSQNKG